MKISAEINTMIILASVVLISVIGLTAITFTGTAVAQEDPTITWSGSGSNGPTVWTQDIQVETTDGTIRFGSDSTRKLRIQEVNTGDEITVTPTGETYDATGFAVNLNDLIRFDGEEFYRADDPEMTVQTNGDSKLFYPVNISGDPTAFYEDTFGEYRVQVIDASGSILTETTETRTLGIGYRAAFKYDGEHLVVERDTGVDPSWHVVFEQRVDGEYQQLTVVDNSAEAENFVIDAEEIDFSPNQSFRLSIYPDEDAMPDNSIITLFGVNGLEEQNMYDDLNVTESNPNGDTGSSGFTDIEVPGFGIPSVLVSLSAISYLLKRENRT